MKSIALATAAAIGIQPFVFFLLFFIPLLVLGADVRLSDLMGMPLLAAAISAPFVLFIGIPAFLLLRYFSRLSWLSLGCAGLIGAVSPFALYGWPLSSRYDGYSSGGNWYGHSVAFFVNGAPTIYGWLEYGQDLLVVGLQGVIGALAFLFIWRRVSDTTKFRPQAS
jgi:hypothetical protein